MKDRRLVSGLLALALLAAGSSAEAATRKPQDWTGIWKRVGSFSFDPSIAPEHAENPPYRPDWQARYEQSLASSKRGQPIADPTASCAPPGMPRMMNMVYPMEIIQKPKQLTIVAEWDSQIRRIFIDGRDHPKDPDPTYNGHSIGHWEGLTLVVDTIGMRDNTVFDQTGLRHSDKLHIVERFRLVDKDTLVDQLTAEDPVAFYRPWTVKKVYRRSPGEQIMEYVCEDNNRNPVGADGKTGIILYNSGK